MCFFFSFLNKIHFLGKGGFKTKEKNSGLTFYGAKVYGHIRHMHGKVDDALYIPVNNDTSLCNANIPGKEAAQTVAG